MVRKRSTAPTGDPALATWATLNDFLRTCKEEDCLRLLDIEKAGRKRIKTIQRIHSRLNRLRAARERQNLLV